MLQLVREKSWFKECLGRMCNGNILTKEPGKTKVFKANSCKQGSVCHSSFYQHSIFTSRSLICFLFRRLQVVTSHSLT